MSKIYRAYTPAEVIDGWKEIVLSRGPSARSKPSSLARPGKSNTPNVAYLQWLHVEMRFLVGPNKRFKPGLLAGDDLESSAAFSDWSKDHTFRLVEGEVEPDPEMVVEEVLLTEACRMRGVHIDVARAAIEAEKLNAFRPRGSATMVVLSAFDAWRGSVKRGGARQGAGRKSNDSQRI